MIGADTRAPSTVTLEPYLWVDGPTPQTEADEHLAGKWMMFVPAEHVDHEWSVVRAAVLAGRLGPHAKVATAYPNPLAVKADERPIIVYTTDWTDLQDVTRVLAVLRDLGLNRRAFYKRDVDTLAGRYGGRVSVYLAAEGARQVRVSSGAPAAAPLRDQVARPAPSAGVALGGVVRTCGYCHQEAVQGQHLHDPKVCRTCHRELPISAFPAHASACDGHRADCHDCAKARGEVVRTQAAAAREAAKAREKDLLRSHGYAWSKSRRGSLNGELLWVLTGPDGSTTTKEAALGRIYAALAEADDVF